ncbi:hypothetical protein AXK12_02215 [Cephaloticoccus capnophilus]|uniref:PEP-CTERM protein-sorting domain-containing protein n=1 Tax=Cephaloticoccus capnophilus TaxID=1548208 RepID=A0A139SRH9_9BACT|nr:hypothetical protein AXK12_02215 [Cephaloticoccus capnophilus]
MAFACASGFVFGLFGVSTVTAQILPPSGVTTYHWDRGAGTNNWEDGANWYNSTSAFDNQVPVSNADLVFGNKPSGTDAQTVILPAGDTAVRSIWFEAGRDYTLQGFGGTFILGAGLEDGGRLVTVLDGGLPANRYTIGQRISLAPADAGNPAKTFEIANYSTDSVLSFLGSINLRGHSLRVTGTGVTYFRESITLSNGSVLSTVASSTTDPTILMIGNIILPGLAATAQFTVGSNTLVIRDGFSSTSVGISTTVQSGGSISMRSGDHLMGTTFLSGLGLVRQAGAAPIGALYADGPTDISTQNSAVITLVADTAFGARSGRSDGLIIRQRIVGAGSSGFTKLGSGLIYLPSSAKQGTQGNQASQWTGATAINGGVLRVGLETNDWWAGLSLASTPLQFNGGILEFRAPDSDPTPPFGMTLGTGAGQVQWLGDGGFSSAAVSDTVTLNGGNSLTWGSGFFVPTGSKLLLSSRYATGEITFTNEIDLGSQLREVRVERGVRSTDAQGNPVENARARMTGALSGTGGGILKTGLGLLWLSSSQNSYSGPTVIREGALRGNIPISSNIELDGGVLALDTNFTRSRFGPNGRIIWQGSGGFAAYGFDRLVQIDNETTSEIVWGSNSFVQAGQELRFGHYTADAAVIWDRVLNFGDAMRTIRVERGQALRGGAPNLTDVIFNRELRNSTKAGGLRLVGDGRAELTADNIALDSDVLEISGAELALVNSNARLGPVGNIALSEGGRFAIRNHGFGDSLGSYDSAQVADTTKVTFNTGTLRYDGRRNEGLLNIFWDLPSVETIGDVVLESGANEIRIHHNMPATGNASYTQLEIGEFKRASSSRATLDLTSNADVTGATASLYTYSATGKVRLSAAATTLSEHMIGGINPWATINGTDWASTDASNANYIANFANYTTGTQHTGNYMPGATVAETNFGIVTLNSLRLAAWSNGSATGSHRATLNGALTLSSGGILANGAVSGISTIAGTGTITTAASRPLYTHAYGNGLQFTGFTSVIGGIDWVKAGPSPLYYNGPTTSQIGSLYIHQGRFELNNGTLNTGANGQVYIGDGAGRDELRILGGTDRLSSRPKVTLRGTPYGRGAEFGAAEDQATLALVNGASQGLRELHIIDRGTIDFRNGTVASPNRLFLDLLTFNNSGAQLFVRGWHEYEDFLLIKKTAYDPDRWSDLLSQVFFDGYSLDYKLLLKDYNADYYEITPWGVFPEPSTYGALLAAAGIALVAWRKKRAAR